MKFHLFRNAGCLLFLLALLSSSVPRVAAEILQLPDQGDSRWPYRPLAAGGSPWILAVAVESDGLLVYRQTQKRFVSVRIRRRQRDGSPLFVKPFALDVDRDGRYAVVNDEKSPGWVGLLDLSGVKTRGPVTLEPVTLCSVDSQVLCVCFRTASEVMLVTASGKLMLCRKNGRPTALQIKLPGDIKPTDACADETGTMFLACSGPSSHSLARISSHGNLLWMKPWPAQLSAVRISEMKVCNRALYVVGDGSCTVWRASDGKFLKSEPRLGGGSLAVTPGGTIFCSSSPQEIRILALPANKSR